MTERSQASITPGAGTLVNPTDGVQSSTGDAFFSRPAAADAVLTLIAPPHVVRPHRMSRAGHSEFLMRLYRRIWLGRIDSRTPEIPPGSIVFAAHYNGAVDGFTYGSQLHGFIGVVSAQWHRHLVGRWLLPGITVQRAKDGVKGANNLSAFREMSRALDRGERLLFFPEGTSRLRRERLPIGRGTLLLLRSMRAANPPRPIFFAAAHYHHPTRWRSNVSVGWVGPITLPKAPEQDESWVQEHLLVAQAEAYAMPVRASYRLTMLAALLALPYLPVWAMTARLARQTADEDNVIALWKFMFGVPATAIAAAIYVMVAIAFGFPLWLPLVALTGGWFLWNR